ncbi:hypothetical protein GCM10010517_01020 [Streptosporangium fragile]|uniref:Uncharacterized protein n=1 Tax=Streptosporangium fragile TaxID=46186 RepID=A0ABP6I7P0_9ACTN
MTPPGPDHPVVSVERGCEWDIVIALAAAHDVITDQAGRTAWCRLDRPTREATEPETNR